MLHTYISTYIHTYIYTYIHTYVRTYIDIYIHTYRQADEQIDICMYVHACMQAYLHIHRIALNHGPGVYFFPAIFNQVTKRDGCLLSEETHAVYNL